MTDPIRWRDDPNAPDGLQSLMQAAEADGPSTAELEALWSGLPLSGGPVPVDLANAGAASAGATVAAKWVVGGTVAAIALSGALWLNQPGLNQQTPDVNSSPGAPPTAPVVADPATAEPTPSIADEANSAGTTDEGAKSKAPALQQRSAAKKSATDTPSDAPKKSEADLLSQAQRALDKDPKKALRLARQHASQFPSGALAQEREVIIIGSLLRLLRSQQAQERSTEFADKYKNSIHAPK